MEKCADKTVMRAKGPEKNRRLERLNKERRKERGEIVRKGKMKKHRKVE